MAAVTSCENTLLLTFFSARMIILPCDVNGLSSQALLFIAHVKRVSKAISGPCRVSSAQVMFSPPRYITRVAW